MGKSQLKQLKESLKERGLLGVKPSQRAKIQKSQKESKKEAPTNPYELKFTKTKHEVLNRKVKGIKGKPGVARKRATENRIQNLLPEMTDKNKTSIFEDKRIGEKNADMTIEDKMFDRFVQEQKRKQKGSVFNLEDDTLTHMGRSLSTIDDFDANDSEEEGHGGIDFKTVRHDHFGGFSDTEQNDETNTCEDGRRKTKAEVMKEVIAKSKFHKQIRQKQKDDDLDIGENLDAEFDEMRDLLFAPQPLPASAFVHPERSEMRDYDKFVRELASEKRAKPTDRLKTDQETAIEEKNKLERLEKERLARMKTVMNPTSTKDRQAQGDDLSDYVFDDSKNRSILEYTKDGELVSMNEDSVVINEHGEMEESEEIGSDEDEDSDINEESNDASSGFEEEEDTINQIPETKKVEIVKELPFVYTAPSTYEELLKYTRNRSPTELDTIITRIRVLHSVNLKAENRQKLLTLLTLLHEHFETTTKTSSSPHTPILQKHLFELSTQFPAVATTHAIKKLESLQKTFLKTGKFCAPNDLLYLEFIGTLFSCTDYRHSVVIPALTFMCQMLSLCAIKSEQFLLIGLYVCKIVSGYLKGSKRYAPEVYNFLFRGLRCLQGSEERIRFPVHPQDKLLSVEIKHGFTNDAILFSELYDGSKGLLVNCYRMLFRVASGMHDNPSFVDIFSSLNTFLNVCDEGVKEILAIEVQKFTLQMCKSKVTRRPLQLQKRKPVPIASYLPKFDEKFSMDRKNNDPNRERAEQMKLKYEHKKEFKGAVRELKRDADFIATQRLKEIKAKDVEYKKKIGGIMGQLSTQEGAMRGYEREKKRSKR